MKNIIKSLALVFALSSFVAQASDIEKNPGTDKEAKEATFHTNVFKGKNATQFYCFVDKQAGQRLTITVRDHKNNIINEQYVSKNETHVAQKMDLSQLPDGDYSLTVASADRMVVHPVRITTAASVRYIYLTEEEAAARK
ncbi:hypothetical protein [Siphonobacter sp. SORGH_AS_0500]|uniref:hypothetical protein n=1 Tax=Siphonobacter sp. SORGH_AS_0500 TaxID=1864824 RepID=UPI0028646316|nr:hypothetical protein [Siphonobacter sp. SORGH_AS_0500]MDR6196796.1 hypothetical protein [Siphonobacter sp. SORGH_AS_0500]